ncbi:MAG: S8 family serine peptidase [Acidobacteria bacterium]|nr:S8 family serine peptidase [Acidobacteriota bacterium]
MPDRLRTWRWFGMLLAVVVLAGLPAATQQAGPQSVLFTQPAGGGDLKQAVPDIQFPAAALNADAVAADRQQAVAALLPKAAGGRVVPVIVGFDTAFVPEGGLDAGRAAAQRAGIAAAREAILSQFVRGSALEIKRYVTIPYFAAHLDSDALQTLAGIAGVTSVVEDQLDAPVLSQSVPIIQANLVHAAGVTGAGKTVAILDTGVDKTHAAFQGRVVSEACYSTNGSGGTSACPGGVSSSTAPGSGVNCPAGYSGCDHGTHVAGIAAGNGGGVLGVAPGASIIAVQVFSLFGAADCGGSPCVLSFNSDQMAGLDRIAQLAGTFSISSVNMSIGGGRYYDAASCDSAASGRKASIDVLRSYNIATVIASGNNGYADSISSPGCISTAVAVGSTDKSGGVSTFSNMHPTMVKLLAPGRNIVSARPGGGTQTMSGTSMATPHVTGAWALWQAVANLRGNVGSVSTIQSAARSMGRNVVDSGAAGSGSTYPEIRTYDTAVLLYTGGGGSAPGAPGGLTASSSGSNIVLSWNAPSSGGAPTGYIIEAGSSPGLANLANFSTGSTATSFSAGGVGAGTYYCRVKASNGSGTSGPSNEATLVVGGSTPPRAPTGLSASVLGAQVRFTWTASAAGEVPASAPTGYLLEAGSSSGANNLGIFNVGNVTSYVADNVARGTYWVRLRAYNSAGTSGTSNEVVVLPNQGTGTGDLSATLTWNTGTSSSRVDMDLHTIEPSGYHVYYGARTGPTARLDVDNTTGLGPENIFVAPGVAANGVYDIYVHSYSGSTWPTTATITVRTNVGTSNERFQTFTRVYNSSGVYQNVATVTFPGGIITERTGTRSVPTTDVPAAKKQ